MNRSWLFVFALLSQLGAAACAKKPAVPDLTTPARAPAPNAGAGEAADLRDQDEAVHRVEANLERIYFFFDRAQMTSESIKALAENARILLSYPSIELEIEGHCDERGTTEYNLSLGQRRADAVKRYLHLYGLPESRVRTVSFGEERPRAVGHDESVWAQNRRAEFRVPRSPATAMIRGSVE